MALHAVLQDTSGAGFWGPVFGGAVTAVAFNWLWAKRFTAGSVAIIGAAAGFGGSMLADTFVKVIRPLPTPENPNPKAPSQQLVLAGVIGSSLGGAVTMLTTDAVVPAELKLK